MKLYQYILSGAMSMGLLFSSCSDWLDVTPVDTRTTENFYTTPSQMEQALIGVYNGLLRCRLMLYLCQRFVRIIHGAEN